MSGTSESGKRIILGLVALCLMAILLSSLWQRFLNPSLVVNRFAPQGRQSAQGSDAGMGAIGALMEAVGKNPQDRASLSRLVEALMAKGQWAAAENFAQRLLSMDPPDSETPRSLFLMAVINHNQGRHVQAAELFEKLLSRAEDPSARFSLALIYLHFLDKPEEGMAQLKKGLAAPNLSQALADAMQEELDKAQMAQSGAAKMPAATGGDANRPQTGADMGNKGEVHTPGGNDQPGQ